jgi:hypothetical protein
MSERAKIKDIGPGVRFVIRDLIDGERRVSYYTRRRGDGDGRFVPTSLRGFKQWDRDGRLRVSRMGRPVHQMTDGLMIGEVSPTGPDQRPGIGQDREQG